MYIHADATTPAGSGGCTVASSPLDGGLPRNTAGSAPAIWSFEACSAFTHVSACMFAESPKAIRFIRGFDGFVTSPPPLRLLPAGTTRRRVGIAPTGNRRLCTAHNILTLRATAKRLFRKALADPSHRQPRVINTRPGTPLRGGNFRSEAGRNPATPLPPPACSIPEQHPGAGSSSDQTTREGQAGLS